MTRFTRPSAASHDTGSGTITTLVVAAPHRRRPPWHRPALLAVAVALGCSSGESATPDGARGPGGGRGPGGDGERAAIPVEVEAVTTGSLAREIAVAGMLEPLRTVGVNAQLPGALLSVRVEEGDVVRAGQVLAEVDAREIAAQVRSAEASLVLATSTAERSEQLWRERIIVAAEYERDQAALVAAQAALDQLRTRLGFATVRAPITGVVLERRVERGDVVGSQARLFSIADVSTLVLRVLVSELDVGGVAEGRAVDVTVDAAGGARFRGTVRRVFPAADTATRMVPVEVALSGAAVRQLKPGFMARVTFQLGERPGVLLVPQRAVVGPVDARAVFVVRGAKAERRPVRLGQTSGGRAEVLDGLAAGDSVVVAGADQVRDGGTVRIVAPVGEGAPPPAAVGAADTPGAAAAASAAGAASAAPARSTGGDR